MSDDGATHHGPLDSIAEPKDCRVHRDESSLSTDVVLHLDVPVDDDEPNKPGSPLYPTGVRKRTASSVGYRRERLENGHIFL